jgi:hypothetical protein
MMKSLISFLIVATTAKARTINRRSTSDAFIKDGFVSTFVESFPGYPNTLPSSSNWIIDLGTQYPGGAERWGNNEFETYTNSTSNIYITSDNNLAIVPQKSADGTWTSGRIETQRSDFQASEGGKLYIESRIKLGDAEQKYQQGIWPAFWALGSDFRGNYTNWPAVSEWDILEVVSGTDLMYSTAHCGYAPGGPCDEYNGLGNGGIAFSHGVWHTIGFMVDRSMTGFGQNGTWLNETLNWYLDGTNVFTISGARVADQATWTELAHGKKFLLLNVAVGGNWPGAPNTETIGGESVGMEVDYVSVWNSI